MNFRRHPIAILMMKVYLCLARKAVLDRGPRSAHALAEVIAIAVYMDKDVIGAVGTDYFLG